jgi:GTP-binding protein
MFIDKAEITIKSGRGGDGAVSFRREPFVPDGGPDGGNGGKGGNIVFVADANLRTLMDFQYKKKYVAEAGQNGMGRKKFGKNGADMEIKVPQGTVIYDRDTGMVMADLVEAGSRFVAALGGKGGYGNTNFKNSVRQAPNFAEAGGESQQRTVLLELKLIADAGLVGYPNVGKSTLLSVSTGARPKIGNYHFTTIAPNLGVVRYEDNDFVLADIPGLIEGAGSGAGLGRDFLRHVERTKMLIHVIDASGSEGRDPKQDFLTINGELKEFSPRLASKTQIVALNKMDITDITSETYTDFIAFLDDNGYEHFDVSAATKKGVRELMNATARTLAKIEEDGYDAYDAIGLSDDEIDVRPIEEDPDYREIHIDWDGDTFVLTGKQLRKIFDSTNFNDYGSLRYLYRYLVKNDVIEKLKERGLEEGDTVKIFDYEFEYTDE